MSQKLNVYCVDWCPDCKKTFRYLDNKSISYQYYNIEELPEKEIQKVNDANDGVDWVTPTFEYNGKWMAFRSVTSEKLPEIMKELGVFE